MKKSLFGIVALAGMLMATSCSQDDLSFKGGKGNVTFSVGVNNPMLTRAISDGTGADKLVYQLYQDGQAVGRQETIDGVSYPQEVSFTNLEVGQAYTVVFWAQNSQCEAYNTNDLTAITVDYTGAKDNDETRDAFYAYQPFTVLGGETAQELDVTLKRPFAQVNVGMLEKQLNGVSYTKSSMTLSGGVNNVFNALTGDASGNDDQDVTFALNAVPDETLSVGEPATEYVWLSMAYVLPGDNVSASFIFEGTPNNATLDFDNVPLQENHRTNILGNVATGDVTINVDQDPNFDGDTDLKGELTAGGVIVNNFTYSLEDGYLTLSASYSGVPYEVDHAQFILTPTTAPQAIRTRAEGDIVLDAELNTDDQTISYKGTPNLVAGQYYAISVFIVDNNDNEYTLTPTGANSPGFTTPEATEPEPGDDGTITVAKALELANALPSGGYSDQEYELIGTVSSIVDASQGNFNLTDETGTIYVYRLTGFDSNVGDKIKIKGKLQNYLGTTPEVVQATLLEVIQYGITLSNVTATPDGTSVSLSATYTNKSNVAVTKCGFKYSGTAEGTVQGTMEDGNLTATVSNLAVGVYTVKAYINDVESASEVTFKISDGTSAPEVTYTINFANNTEEGAGQCNQYNESWSWTTAQGTWNLYGVSNNNKAWNYLKSGGKSGGNQKGTISTGWAIPEAIQTVTTNAGLIINNTSGTVTLEVATDSSFSETIGTYEAQALSSTIGDLTFIITQPQANCYYRLTYNAVNSTSSNGNIRINSVTLKN